MMLRFGISNHIGPPQLVQELMVATMNHPLVRSMYLACWLNALIHRAVHYNIGSKFAQSEKGSFSLENTTICRDNALTAWYASFAQGLNAFALKSYVAVQSCVPG
jgi:hypothetical protein